MPATPQAADVLKSLEGHPLLTAQVTFYGVALGGSTQFLDITVLEILHPGIGVDPCLGQDRFGTGRTDAIDVREGDFNPLVAGNVNAGDPCQGVSIEREQ